MTELKKTLGPVGSELENIRGAGERAKYKGQAIVDALSRIEHQEMDCGDYQVQIKDLRAFDEGVKYDARVFQNGKAVGMGRDGSVEWERFQVVNPPILVPDGTKTEFDTIKGKRLHDNYEENLEAALLADLAHTISVKQQKHGPEGIVKGRVGQTTTTVYPDAHPETNSTDGWARRANASGENWATMRAGAGDYAVDDGSGASNGIILMSCNAGAAMTQLRRAFTGFSIRAVSSGDVIDSAVWSIYLGVRDSDGSQSGVLTNGDLASDTAIVAADYQNHGGTTECSASRINFSSHTENAYNSLTLDSDGLAVISAEKGSGTANFGFIFSADFDNSDPSSVNLSVYITGRYADYTGTSSDPKLVIEHSTPWVPKGACRGVHVHSSIAHH